MNDSPIKYLSGMDSSRTTAFTRLAGWAESSSGLNQGTDDNIHGDTFICVMAVAWAHLLRPEWRTAARTLDDPTVWKHARPFK
jgi:hypothetical protein